MDPNDPYRHNVEPKLATGLKDHGCTVMSDPEMDGAYKIDILVTKIRDRPGKFDPVGIQVTTGLDIEEKIRRFRTESVKFSGIGVLLYIEVVGYVSHRAIRGVKAAIGEILDEVGGGRKSDPKPPIRRMRLYQDGFYRWLPIQPE